MKLIVFWVCLFVIGFMMPSTPFMVGSWFGIAWAFWVTDYFKEKND